MTGQRINWLGWILVAVLCLQSVAVAQQPQGSGIPPGDVEEVLADNARKNAEQRRQQAKQWREMAEKARARAAEVSERAEKEIWENTAERREEEARKLDAEADGFEKEEAEHAAKAEQKKAQVAGEQAAKAAEEKAKGAQGEPKPPAEPAEVGKVGGETQPPVEPAKPEKTDDTAQLPEDGGIPDDATIMERQARQSREYANALRTLAGQWRELALRARASFARATHPAVKKMWEYSAELDDAQSRRLESEAVDLDKEAAELEAAAARERAKPKVAGADNVPPVEDFLGRWKNLDDDSRTVIEPLYPSEPDRKHDLRLETKKHDWGGIYNPGQNPSPSRLSFTKAPKWEEMNREIPEWARKEVEGKLRWSFEINTDDECSVTSLKAKWFPGEISWNEAGGQPSSDGTTKAWVSGKGEPISLNYEKVPDDAPEMISRPVVFVLSTDRKEDRYTQIDAVSSGQPFLVKVVLPFDLGEKQGGELEVTLRASKSGGEVKVRLHGTGAPAGPWEYLPDQPIIIAPKVRIEAYVVEFLLELYAKAPPGSFRREPTPGTIDLNAENGEIITVSYESESEFFAVFDDPVKLATDRVRTELDDLTVKYQTQILMGAVSRERLESARRKLQQIANARTIMAHEPEAVEAWPDHMLLAIGLQYLTVIKNDDEALHQDKSTLQEPPDEFGVVYTSTREKNTIRARIEKIKTLSALDVYLKELREQVRNRVSTAKVLSHMLSLNVDDVFMAFRGTDFEGNPVDKTTRLPWWGLNEQDSARVRLPLTIFMQLAGLRSAASGKIPTTAAGRVNQLRVTQNLAKLKAARRGLPPIARLIRPGLDEMLPARAVSRPGLAGLERQLMLRKLYGKNRPFTLDEADNISRYHSEMCPKDGCGAGALTWGIEVVTGERLSPAEIVKSITEKGLPFNWIKNPGVEGRGLSLVEIQEVLQGRGLTVRRYQATMEQVARATDKGNVVFTSIKYTTGEPHIVAMAKTTKNTVGKGLTRVKEVKYFDVNAAARANMARCHFEELRTGGKIEGGLVLELVKP